MPPSFEQFATDNLRSWLRLAGALTADAGLAEDLVQEVVLKIHKRWSQMGTVQAPQAYVRRMITNEYLSWRRSRSAQIVPTDNNVLEDLRATGVDPTVGHADRDALRREIARLPRQQQAVLALRYYGGLTDTEIATILECAPRTVRGYASPRLGHPACRIHPPSTVHGKTMIMHRTENDLHDHYAHPLVDPATVDRLTNQIADLGARRRHWIPAAAAIAVVIMVGGGAAVLHSQRSPTPETAAATPPGASPQASPASAPAAAPATLAGKIMLQRFVDLLPRPGTLTHFVDLSHENPGPVQVVYDDGHGAAAIIAGMYPSTNLPCASQAGDTCSTRPDGTKVRIHQGPEYPSGHTPNATSWSVDILRPDKVTVSIHEWNAPTEKGSPPSRAVPPFTIAELTAIATNPSWTPDVSPDLAVRAATLYVPDR